MKEKGKPKIILRNKKYGLTEETKSFYGHILHRIIALHDISFSVKKGDLGGFIESQENLSVSGKSWIYDESIVYGKAKILEDAIVEGNSRVTGNLRISGQCTIKGSKIGSDKDVCYLRVNGLLKEDVCILIYGSTRIENSTVIGKNIRISESKIQSTHVKDEVNITKSDISNASITNAKINNSVINGQVSILGEKTVRIDHSNIEGQHEIVGPQLICGKTVHWRIRSFKK